MKRFLILATMALLPLAFASSANAAGERFFVGLWHGIDRLDGGEALYSITCSRDGACEFAATDRRVSLCGEEPGFVTGTGGGFEGDELVFPDAVVRCPDGSSATFLLGFDRDRFNRTLVGTSVVDGVPFRSIIFHKVSR
jgi:hypothetical protein